MPKKPAKKIEPEIVSDTLETLTEKLAALRYSMDGVEAQYKEVITPLSLEKNMLELEILHRLKGSGLHATPEAKAGEYFIRTVTMNYGVSDEEEAFRWGAKHSALRLDKVKANSILHRIPRSEVPKCFEITEKETLTIKRPINNEPVEDK